MDQGVVQAVSMAEEVVVVEVLAMIGGHDHERIVEQATRLEFREEPPDLVVEVGDATVIGIAEELGGLADDGRGVLGRILLMMQSGVVPEE